MPPAAAGRAIAAAGFCAMVNLYGTQAILPELAQSFAVSPATAAATISVTTLSVALFGPFAGVVADRFGRKRVIVASLLLLAVPTLLSALAVTLPQLMLGRFVQGVFMPAAFTACLGYVAQAWGREGAGRVMSLYVAANVSGGFAGRFIGGLAADLAAWPWAFVALAGINLAGAGIVWAWLPADASRVVASAPGPRAVLRGIGMHLRNPMLLAAYLVGFALLFGLVTIFTYITFRLAGPPWSLSPVALGAVFCVYLVGVVVTPWAGQAIDRWGQRRALLVAGATAMLGVLMTLSASLLVIVAGLAIFCTASFVCQSATTSQVGLVAGEHRSSAAGLYLSFYYAGGGLGALLPGLLWAWHGWLACVLLTLAVQAVALAVTAGAWERR